MKPVDIVTIEKLLPIWKDGEAANAIEVARIKNSEGESLQYNIIVGKGMYNIGDTAIYIQPDYCIPQTELFKEYHMPDGNPSKSKLGKRGRIRAIKFNFQFESGEGPIYSNGILIPSMVFSTWFAKNITTKKSELSNEVLNPPYDIIDNLQEVLKITKYEADDSFDGSQMSGMTAGFWPSFMYKTDEETIENHKKSVDTCFKNNEVLSFSKKLDGSSATIISRIDPETKEREGRVFSRKLEKKLDQTAVTAYKDGDVILHKYFNKETKIRGWYNDATQKFYTDEEVTQFEPIEELMKDDWVDVVRKYGYLEKLTEYCEKYNIELALRGELVGAGNKGSGNKLNADAKSGEAKIVWFGVDSLSSGVARRLHYDNEHNLEKVCEELDLEYTREILSGTFSYDQIIKHCEIFFKMIKQETGQVIEGIVIRTKFTNNLSVKYINSEYDEKN
ncbi:MAG: hypothetical protein H8E98_08650 [Bacteroidetes bacterium]|nr:hypothetical protein [Bacteroidota bacterium]